MNPAGTAQAQQNMQRNQRLASVASRQQLLASRAAALMNRRSNTIARGSHQLDSYTHALLERYQTADQDVRYLQSVIRIVSRELQGKVRTRAVVAQQLRRVRRKQAAFAQAQGQLFKKETQARVLGRLYGFMAENKKQDRLSDYLRR